MCPFPAHITRRQHESHETFSALPHSVKHCSRVEDERSARCNKRAPRLECHRRNAYVIAPRSTSVAIEHIASYHRRYLRFAFEGQTYQYTVLPFGLSLAPRTFTKCMDAALAPLRLRGMRVLNYLDYWLILAQSRSQLVEHRTILLDHLENLGITVNWAKSSLNPSQTISFLGIVLDSQSMTARLSPQRVLHIQRAARSFRRDVFTPLRKFQRMLGLMASASSVLQLGLLRMRPLQFWLKARVPRGAWVSGRLRLKVNQSCVTALIPWLADGWYQSGVSLGTSSRVRMVSTDASTSGWGALLEGRPFFGLWSEREKLQHINCLEMLAVHNALTRFCPHIKDQHVVVRLDNTAVVSHINRQGGLKSTSLYRLAKRLLIWAQHNLRSLRAVHVPGLQNVGPDRLSRNKIPLGEWSLHPQTVRLLWERFGRAEVDLFASREKRSLPRVLFQERQRAVLDVAALPAIRFPPRLPPATASRLRSMASAIEERSPLAGQELDLAPTPGAVVPSCVGAQRISVDLAEGVINTITQARAPSTRRLYASKWSVFSGWCTARSISPIDCEVTEVLSFLQELLDKGRSPSTLKVYVAAITAFSGTTLGQSLGRNDLVIRFLRGARRLNPPRPPSVPMWDLSTVLAAMKGCPGSLYDAESVDGAPTVNLSHQKEKPVTEASGIREERMKSWDDQHRHAGGAEALLDLHESAEDPDDTTEMSHDRQDAGCQTDLTMDDTERMEDILKANHSRAGPSQE
ncbi:unnamed protein product [Leuciscus chuanchicus]